MALRLSRRTIRRVRKAPAEFTERQLNRQAREAIASAIEAQWPKIVAGVTSATDTAAMLDRIGANASRGVVLETIPFGVFEDNLRDHLEDWYERAVSAGAGIGFRFSALAVDPAVVTEAASEFIAYRAVERSHLIVGASRDACALILDRGLRDHISPTQMADQLGAVTGLTPRQANSLVNYEAGLRRQLIPVGELPTREIEQTIARRVAARRKHLLRDRGRMIADTEAQYAIHWGEREYWATAERQGEVVREKIRRRWKTVRDDRVCGICEPLHNKVLGFNQNYPASTGPLLGPPAHVRCRCYIEYTVLR